ncbi:MAG: nitroreductase family protein [Tissierellaceae bacterium]
MIISNFLRNRKSVREFKPNEVSYNVLDDITQILNSMVEEEGSGSINFKLYENGKHIHDNLEGKGGYAGVMIDSPHYIALELKDERSSTMISGAYYMEKLITELNEMGLGTCWVSVESVGEDLKKRLFGDFTGKIDYILAFGYEKRQNPFNEEPFSERMGIEEIVFNGKIGKGFTINELESKGLADIFYYVRFAPSTKNLQPWRFLMKENAVELLLAYKKWDDHLLMDAGIVMYYFETLAKYQGIKNRWELVEEDGKKIEDIEYRLVAKYRL